MCPKHIVDKKAAPLVVSSQPASSSRFPLPPDIPLKDLDTLLHSHGRYNLSFQYSKEFQNHIPDINVPGDLDRRLQAVVIQAPLNSVEIFEAILRPAAPLRVYRARHVGPQMPPTSSDELYQKARTMACLRRDRALYCEYKRFQGRLEKEDREVAFVCLSNSCISKLSEFFRHTIWGYSFVRSFYILPSLVLLQREDGSAPLDRGRDNFPERAWCCSGLHTSLRCQLTQAAQDASSSGGLLVWEKSAGAWGGANAGEHFRLVPRYSRVYYNSPVL